MRSEAAANFLRQLYINSEECCSLQELWQHIDRKSQASEARLRKKNILKLEIILCARRAKVLTFVLCAKLINEFQLPCQLIFFLLLSLMAWLLMAFAVKENRGVTCELMDGL